jgi:hypothetical protein
MISISIYSFGFLNFKAIVYVRIDSFFIFRETKLSFKAVKYFGLGFLFLSFFNTESKLTQRTGEENRTFSSCVDIVSFAVSKDFISFCKQQEN